MVLDAGYDRFDTGYLLCAMSHGHDVYDIIATGATGNELSVLLQCATDGIDINQIYKKGASYHELDKAYKEYRMSAAYLSEDDDQKRAMGFVAKYRNEKTIDELFQIYLGAYFGIEPEIYANGYSVEQMLALREELMWEHDVSLALNPDYEPERMRLIVRAVYLGLDPKYAVDLHYSVDQVRTLIEAQRLGLDAEAVAKSNLDSIYAQFGKMAERGGKFLSGIESCFGQSSKKGTVSCY